MPLMSSNSRSQLVTDTNQCIPQLLLALAIRELHGIVLGTR